MSTTRKERFLKTIALLPYFVAALFVFGSAQAQNNDRSKGICPWPGKLDGVIAAPETHKVMFENEHVRVLEDNPTTQQRASPYALFAQYALYPANW